MAKLDSIALTGRAWATQEAAQWLEYRRRLQPDPVGASKRLDVNKPKDAVEADEWNNPTPAPAPSLQRFRRPHLLHLEVGELMLNSTLLDLNLSWYETARYFASFHPSSVKLPTVHLPREPPRPQPNANYMVSTSQPSKPSQTQTYDEEECIQFNEQMDMHSERLDSHFLLFLWCCKTSMLSESTVLLGYRPLPLRDLELHSRWATWDIADMASGQELAQLSLRMDVIAPPSEIQLPHLSDVSETGFTLNWSEPLGAASTAYAVSVRLADGAAALSRQLTTGHSASLSGLQPGTTYVVDVRAMNQAGWGDSCKLEASTAFVQAREKSSVTHL
ncbi:unnamed protein product [Durusdinium trenchii]|uniref:Fibronectin type-III domain-containing protein n=1 Tax=Durusdinium trenchii TaxID=1381693 RepID=A0ABP0NEX3_9DINO